MRRWFSIPEVAAELGLTPNTVRKLVRERRMEARVLLGGTRPIYRISEEALATYRKTYVRDTLRDDWE